MPNILSYDLQCDETNNLAFEPSVDKHPVYSKYLLMRGSRVGRGGPDTPSPLENNKAVGFFGNTGPDPLENHEATKPAFNIGQSSARQ